MKVTVYAAREVDAHEGWVWLHNLSLPPRAVVRIECQATALRLHCEVLQIDENFLRQYNQSPRHHIVDCSRALVINDWHRKKLGSVATQSEIEISVTEPWLPWWGSFCACIDHPQIVVRLATWLGGLGLLLGVIGLILGALSLR